MAMQLNGKVNGNNVQVNVRWIHVIATILLICSTLVGGMWWLIGARTRAVLNEDFWASERIRPSMRLYIAERTVSREEFLIFVTKWEIAMAKIEAQLDVIEGKIEVKTGGKK